MSDKRKFPHVRNRLADWLSFLACKLRGDRWYVADTWHGIPGNRAAELRQQIFLWCVLTANNDWPLKEVEPQLEELGQLARENCGHVWPKDEASA